MKIERDVPLARLTTLGTGGPARFFARPESLSELEEALALAEQEGLGVAVVGLGSNLLAADEAVDRVVIRLAGEVADVAVDGERVSAGGGATNAVVLHRARQAGLGGFEFACIGEICAPPIWCPFKPQASSIRPAVNSCSGFLKTLPNVRLFVGCAAFRRAWSSQIVALMSSG